MKLNTLLVAAVLASTSLSSCVFKTADENQLKYTHTTLVDGDGYAFFRQVGSIAPYEVSYAQHVATVGNAQAKDAAAKASKFFSDILPQMDSLATKYHVDFPILGTEKFTGPGEENIAVEPNAAPVVVQDSTIADTAAPLVLQHAKVYSDAEYLSHIQHQVALVKEQFKRLSRNTNKDLRDFAQGQTETIAQLFTAVGGKEDAHAHH
ncbi:hypothetical protein [Sphingobacterium endophyticum]|uniref:hypothetical protein n=1 Tax=Sphingobacterium endophyticum TaxID=2546448 RepID=UPI0012E302A1|nr:hypothetical protein [Sphingobacterium endophyticum]